MATGSEIALESARVFTRRYLSKATWRETYRDTFGEPIILRQTPLLSVVSVEANGAPLVLDTDYHIDWKRARILFQCAWWSNDLGNIVITYEAGYDPLPPDLQAAIDAAGASIDASIAAGGGVAGIASIDMPDVGAVRFIDTATAADGLVPALQPFAGTLSAYRDNSVLWTHDAMRRIELLPPAARGQGARP